MLHDSKLGDAVPPNKKSWYARIIKRFTDPRTLLSFHMNTFIDFTMR